MPDYKSLYFTLFNKLADIIEELREMQVEMEEMFMDDEDEDDYE